MIEIAADEAVQTSRIEGELLDRVSVRSSLRHNFGLSAPSRRSTPAERGIADMMTDAYQTFAQPLTHARLHAWHAMLCAGREDLEAVGRYRTHAEPMRVVSGILNRPAVHFEAPPSSAMDREMEKFLSWFAESAPGAREALPALTRAGIAHLYFVSIHPYEDGNGRIARALAEKALAQCLREPTLLTLSRTLERSRDAYYSALERNNKDLEITDWLTYFAKAVLDAQDYSIELVDFLIEKTKLFDRLGDRLNERQKKAVERMFRAGPEGFEGGLSAENYIKITRTSRATATRDLQDLAETGVLVKTEAIERDALFLERREP